MPGGGSGVGPQPLPHHQSPQQQPQLSPSHPSQQNQRQHFFQHQTEQKFPSPGSSDGSRVIDGTTTSCSSTTAATAASTTTTAIPIGGPSAATDSGGSTDGRAQQQQDGRPRSRENKTSTQDANGGGLDAAAIATVTERPPQEAETRT